MSEDRFLERLREDARRLRYEPADSATWTRLGARIDERVRSKPTVAQLLSAWFRPIGASFAAVALVAGLSVVLIEPLPESTGIEAMASAPASVADLAADGETFGVE